MFLFLLFSYNVDFIFHMEGEEKKMYPLKVKVSKYPRPRGCTSEQALFYFFLKMASIGAGQTTLWVKSLPCKCEDLSSNL